MRPESSSPYVTQVTQIRPRSGLLRGRMAAYARAMSIHRPAPSAQIIAVAAVMALIVTTLVIALASIAVGAYPHPEVEEQGGTQTASTPATTSTEAPHRQAGPASSTSALLDPSVGRGAASQACAVSPRSPRCRLEGGGSMSITRGGHALRPATDGPETLLHSEWDETGPADMPGRAPGRGGWVGEQGPSVA